MIKRLFLLIACALAGLAAAPACTTTKVVAPAESGALDNDAGSEETGEEGGGGTQCTTARDQLLVPIAKVATAEVKVVSEADGVKTIYVDASAGGFDQARRNPRVYITLAGEKVDVNDKDALSSSEWDLAFKRQVIFTNSGDAGPGKGGGAMITKGFDAVTAADADAVVIAPESFFDAECNAKTDPISDPVTTFTGWYDYDQASMRASAKPGVSFIVKSAAGVRHKVGIVSYTGKPDGSTDSPATGYFLLKVAQL
jgi:uncharacterized protein (UPF0335 family)